jgi:hypothetical protein
LKEDNPSEVLQDRDLESLKNRFQLQIQRKMNIYNKYYKQVKECPAFSWWVPFTLKKRDAIISAAVNKR